MANSDKVRQAAPLAKMSKRFEDILFTLETQNGFFLSIDGHRVSEFQTLSDGTIMVSSLNTAIQPIVNSFISTYESRIGNIIA